MSRLATYLFLVSCASTASGCHQASDRSSEAPPASTARVETIPDGVYLIARSAEQMGELLPLGQGERVVRYDGGTEEYLVVSDEPDVPLALREPATRVGTVDGKPVLSLVFTSAAAEKLRALTEVASLRTGSVAVIAGGHVISTHKVREPISGGRVRTSCCVPAACDRLLAALGDGREGVAPAAERRGTGARDRGGAAPSEED